MPLLQAKGTEYVFKEPYRYIWLFALLIFGSLTYSASLANLYMWMIVTSAAIWLILNSQGRKQIVNLNAPSGSNTLQSMLLGGIFLMVFIGISIYLMGIFQNAFSTTETQFSAFLSQNALIFLGATAKPIFAESKFLGFLFFGLIIPVIETELVIRFTELLLMITKVKNPISKFGLLKEIKFWISALLVTVAMTWYHIQAKGLTADISLMMVAIFFLISIIIAFIPFFGTQREGETATWLHIFNNSLAVSKTLGIIH